MEDLVDKYMKYTWETESARIYHRWCILAAIGAAVGREAYIQHGHFRIFPTMYTILIGDAGARKSVAIKLVRKLMEQAGYEQFAADRTSKEKFLLDLEGLEEEESEENVLNANLWGKDSEAFRDPKECFICADELNQFMGTNNLEFHTLLGDLWDWDKPDKPFSQRLKNSKSVEIYQPTISLLGGSNQELFYRTFPPETCLGHGILSRTILIYGEKSSRRYTFPPEPDSDFTAELVRELRRLTTTTFGRVSFDGRAVAICEDMYVNDKCLLTDINFKNYNTRRQSQLFRLATCIAAARDTAIITEGILIKANTVLCAAEHLMPKALGEFGRNKDSVTVNKVMEVLLDAIKPMTVKEIWQQVHNDLSKMSQLCEILQNLQVAEKIQHVSGTGYLPKQTRRVERDYVDFSLLTEEEREGL